MEIVMDVEPNENHEISCISFIDDISNFLVPANGDRSIIYFACGLPENLLNVLDNEQCSELIFARNIDSGIFNIVDHFPGPVAGLRVLFLLASIRYQLSLPTFNDTVSATVSGGGFDPLLDETLASILKNKSIKHNSHTLHEISGHPKKYPKDVRIRCINLYNELYEFYEENDIRIKSNKAQVNDGLNWFVWTQYNTASDITIRFMQRLHGDLEDFTPEFIITIEYNTRVVETIAAEEHLSEQFNCDEIEIEVDSTADSVENDEQQSHAICVILRLQRGDTTESESKFVLPNEVYNTTLDDIQHGFDVCFLEYVDQQQHTIYGGTRSVVLNSNIQVREYVSNGREEQVVFMRIVTGAPIFAAVDHREQRHDCFRPQRQVAQGILKRVCRRLTGGDELDALREKFNRMNFVVLVPKFNSLKQQTKERLEKASALVRPGQDSSECVELYGNNSARARVQGLKEKILKNADELFVMIVDECHYGPRRTKENTKASTNNTAIPLLHDPDLRNCNNFVCLLVSATPYNCLSDCSSIAKENLVNWSEQIDPDDRPNYIGFEHYFRSVAFRLENEFHFDVRIHDTLYTVEMNRFQEFADYESLATAVTAQMARVLPIKLLCVYEEQRFLFRLQKKLPHKIIVLNSSFLKALGFDVDVVCTHNSVPEHGEVPRIGSNVPVVKQHLREDSHFAALFTEITSKCKDLARYKLKTNAKLLDRTWDGLISDGREGLSLVPKPVLKYKMMSAKNGFTILIDYLLSMAYYGSCRVVRDAPSGAISLSNDYPAEVTDDICDRFLQMVDSCCYFDDVSTQQSCNIGEALNAVLEALYQSAFEEMSVQTVLNRRACLKYILKQKFDEEPHQALVSDNQTWYTETDRIVRMLISERKQGPMVLLRVYDTDENRSMQILLRHAMKVCQLTIERPGQSNIPAFSVISDTSDTSLLNEIEPYFRDEHDIGQGMHLRDFKSIRENQCKAEGKEVKAANLDLKYEDLLNVPCLIILCEKGRMGDTFPHTLRALDLRLRTGGTASCFLQEIGRMCRYPKCRDSAVFLSTDTVGLTEKISTSPFGVTVSDAESGGFLGVASTETEIQIILRGTFVNLTYVQIKLESLVHPLPYSLIDPAVMEAIRTAVNKREASFVNVQDPPNSFVDAEERRNGDKIIQHLKMVRGVDDYLSCKMIKSYGEYRLAKAKRHYDVINEPGNHHKLRFLLFAECQVGKTGAYLHFLKLLRDAIEGQLVIATAIPQPPVLTVGSYWCKWLVPSIKNLKVQPEMLYDYPKKGKYHRSIAQQRLSQLASLMRQGPHEFAQRFRDMIQTHEHTITDRGQARLSALQDSPFDNNGQLVNDTHILEKYVNWDGRFLSKQFGHNPANLSIMLKQCTPHLDQVVALAQNVMFGQELSHYSTDEHADEDDDSENDQLVINADQQVTVNIPSNESVKLLSAVAKTFFDADDNTNNGYVEIGIAAAVLTVFCATHHLEHDFKDDCIISVPCDAVDNTKLGKGMKLSGLGGSYLRDVLKVPQRIKSWIFTPSFCGTNVGPESKLLMRGDAYSIFDEAGITHRQLKRWTEYGEVIMVRKSQLAMYQRYYGGTHIIVAMPDSMTYLEREMKTSNGCGYTRRFSQLIAHYLGMSAIWMIDDYVLKCWKLVCKDLVCRKDNVSLQPATFAEVMLHIEAMFYGDITASVYPHADVQLQRMIKLRADGESLVEITGAMAKYGIIGTCRGRQWRSNIVNPVKKSYSVYSFFLLNVKDTVAKRLFFPARPIWEDIEFNNLLDENGLVVCKMQVFAHEKQVHAAANGPIVYTLLQWIRDTFKPLNIVVEQLMMEPVNSVSMHPIRQLINDIEKALPSEGKTPMFLSVAYNPTASQHGLFKGKFRTRSLQSCIDDVLDYGDIAAKIIKMTALSGSPHTWLIVMPSSEFITDILIPLRTDDYDHVELTYSYLSAAFHPEEFVIVQVIATLQMADVQSLPVEAVSAELMVCREDTPMLQIDIVQSSKVEEADNELMEIEQDTEDMHLESNSAIQQANSECGSNEDNDSEDENEEQCNANAGTSTSPTKRPYLKYSPMQTELLHKYGSQLIKLFEEHMKEYRDLLSTTSNVTYEWCLNSHDVVFREQCQKWKGVKELPADKFRKKLLAKMENYFIKKVFTDRLYELNSVADAEKLVDLKSYFTRCKTVKEKIKNESKVSENENIGIRQHKRFSNDYLSDSDDNSYSPRKKTKSEVISQQCSSSTSFSPIPTTLMKRGTIESPIVFDDSQQDDAGDEGMN